MKNSDVNQIKGLLYLILAAQVRNWWGLPCLLAAIGYVALSFLPDRDAE
jgi:hypothetical protein